MSFHAPLSHPEKREALMSAEGNVVSSVVVSKKAAKPKPTGYASKRKKVNKKEGLVSSENTAHVVGETMLVFHGSVLYDATVPPHASFPIHVDTHPFTHHLHHTRLLAQ
jgi:hypothetical protein